MCTTPIGGDTEFVRVRDDVPKTPHWEAASYEAEERTLQTMLDVLDVGHCTPEHPAPLVFVHGAWHGAWCWDEHFLGHFAAKGYRAIALDLRGYGMVAAVRSRYARRHHSTGTG